MKLNQYKPVKRPSADKTETEAFLFLFPDSPKTVSELFWMLCLFGFVILENIKHGDFLLLWVLYLHLLLLQ